MVGEYRPRGFSCDKVLILNTISMGESNTVVSAYTTYRHLQQYCFHPAISSINNFSRKFLKALSMLHYTLGVRRKCFIDDERNYGHMWVQRDGGEKKSE